MKNTKNIFSLFTAVLLVVGLLGGCVNGGSGSQSAVDIPLDDILEAIRAPYGEDYLPNLEIPAEVLEGEFGLTEDLYVEAKGEMPMMSAHNDRVLIVRAADGKVGEVEAVLNTARENKINNELQYPMNMPKTNAAKVVRQGDYVAFLLVGLPPADAGTEEEAAEFSETEVQKAVDAFNGLFE